MHRISLRGPWDLVIFDDRIEATRKFHAPPGFVDLFASQSEVESVDSSVRLQFGWQCDIEYPATHFLVNDLLFPLENNSQQNLLSGMIFQFDSQAGVGTVDLAGILLPFNKVTLVWSRWPIEWLPISGRYTPNPQHPLHFDSWLDIDE